MDKQKHLKGMEPENQQQPDTKQYVAYQDVERYCNELARSPELNRYIAKLKEKNGMELQGVYGPPRGGVLMAQILADKLGIPVLGSPCEGCIFVDDIADHGRTMRPYAERNTNYGQYQSPEQRTEMSGKVSPYFLTTMFYHPQSKQISGVEPQFYTDMKSHDVKSPGKWVVFPHEKTNEYWTKEKVGNFQEQIAKSGDQANVTWQQVDGFLHKVFQQVAPKMQQAIKEGKPLPGVYATNGNEFMAAVLSNVLEEQFNQPVAYLQTPTKDCIMLDGFANKLTEFYQETYGTTCYSMFGDRAKNNCMINITEKDRAKLVMPHMQGAARRELEKQQYGVKDNEARDLFNR